MENVSLIKQRWVGCTCCHVATIRLHSDDCLPMFIQRVDQQCTDVLQNSLELEILLHLPCLNCVPGHWWQRSTWYCQLWYYLPNLTLMPYLNQISAADSALVRIIVTFGCCYTTLHRGLYYRNYKCQKLPSSCVNCRHCIAGEFSETASTLQGLQSPCRQLLRSNQT